MNLNIHPTLLHSLWTQLGKLNGMSLKIGTKYHQRHHENEVSAMIDHFIIKDTAVSLMIENKVGVPT